MLRVFLYGPFKYDMHKQEIIRIASLILHRCPSHDHNYDSYRCRGLISQNREKGTACGRLFSARRPTTKRYIDVTRSVTKARPEHRTQNTEQRHITNTETIKRRNTAKRLGSPPIFKDKWRCSRGQSSCPTIDGRTHRCSSALGTCPRNLPLSCQGQSSEGTARPRSILPRSRITP